MNALQSCATWSQACSVLALAALCIVLTLLRGARGAPHPRERIAAREESNGRMLLRIAEDMDAGAAELDGAGARRQRAWARACRRAAVDHLACINLLLLEPGADRALDAISTRDHRDP